MDRTTDARVQKDKNHVWRLSLDVCVCVELNFVALGLLEVWQ